MIAALSFACLTCAGIGGDCTCPIDEAAELEDVVEAAAEAEHQAWLMRWRWTF